jgi:hypothetical protein
VRLGGFQLDGKEEDGGKKEGGIVLLLPLIICVILNENDLILRQISIYSTY